VAEDTLVTGPAGGMIRQRCPFHASGGEPTVTQEAAAGQDTQSSWLSLPRLGEGSRRQERPYHARARVWAGRVHRSSTSRPPRT
jgi:hypothetical protein